MSDAIGRIDTRADAEPRIATTYSPRLKFARWLVMILSVANVLAAAVILALIWKTAANTGTPLPTRISDSVYMGGSLLLAGVVFLIAWRAGDQPGNILLALAFAFGGTNSISWILFKQLGANNIIPESVNIPTFILGAGFFILASARFPRKLTPLDIVSSRTIWGRIKPLRAILILFLRAPAVWVFVAAPVILSLFMDIPVFNHVHWFAIVMMGVIYFYIMYRSGNVETRRKVLWFFELTLFLLVINLLRRGIYAVLPNNSSETLRVIILAVYHAVFSVAQLFCVCMAVFYAGAISPALVIRKTFVYGVTAALLLFAYATAEAFVTNFLTDKIGVSNSFANALLGTVLALAFHPIKNRMEHALKRLGPQPTGIPVNADAN
jgi:hypothetical protein